VVRGQVVASPGVGTGRLETFADGVFAIAATLLILSVDTQVSSGSTRLGHDLLRIWPSYAAYAVSFVTIGVIWVNHHTVMNQVRLVDRAFLLQNIVFLLCVAFIPFPTRLLAEQIRTSQGTVAAVTYGVTLTVTAVMFNVIWLYASRGDRLLRPDRDEAVVRGITRSYRPGPFLYAFATLVALLSAAAAGALFGAITVFYVVESSVFGRTRHPA
jgi:uncharacterized membrane protein